MQQESNNQTPPTTQTSRRSRGRYREPLINDCDCRMKCGSKISVAKQIEINTQFWTLSKKGQQSFILNFSHRRPIKRRQESNFRRLFSYDYQLEDEHGLLQDVCSAFFLNTLGYDVRSRFVFYVRQSISGEGNLKYWLSSATWSTGITTERMQDQRHRLPAANTPARKHFTKQ